MQIDAIDDKVELDEPQQIEIFDKVEVEVEVDEISEIEVKVEHDDIDIDEEQIGEDDCDEVDEMHESLEDDEIDEMHEVVANIDELIDDDGLVEKVETVGVVELDESVTMNGDEMLVLIDTNDEKVEHDEIELFADEMVDDEIETAVEIDEKP